MQEVKYVYESRSIILARILRNCDNYTPSQGLRTGMTKQLISVPFELRMNSCPFESAKTPPMVEFHYTGNHTDRKGLHQCDDRK